MDLLQGEKVSDIARTLQGTTTYNVVESVPPTASWNGELKINPQEWFR